MDFRENLGRSKEVLGAYFRQGLHELGAAFYGPGTVAQHPEYGMVGTKPPSLVVEGMRGDGNVTPSRDDATPSALEAHLKDAKELSVSEREPERDSRDLEKE
jgi:hypothetical protein